MPLIVSSQRSIAAEAEHNGDHHDPEDVPGQVELLAEDEMDPLDGAAFYRIIESALVSNTKN